MKTQAILIVREDDAEGERRTVRIEPGSPLVVGRSRDCDVRLADTNVSARHATLRVEDGALFVTDAGSLNGTRVVQGGSERRLEPDQDTPVPEDAVIRVCTFSLIPCEVLGEGVVMSTHVDLDMPTRGESAHARGRTTVFPPSAEAALRALARCAERGSETAGSQATWRTVLDGLMEITSASRGFLLARVEGGFTLQVSRGQGSLSKSFLEQTVGRGSPWCFRPSMEVETPEAEASPSLMAQDPGITLIGVPFRSGTEQAFAVGYLIRDPGDPVELDPTVELYAQAAAPLLEAVANLDREVRRREGMQSLQAREARDPVSGVETTVALVGDDPAFLEAVNTIRRAAPAETNLLIRGPSGSGKEQLAQLAHVASSRDGHPFVVLNCAAMPETLIESELFGADRGAYTGADRDRAGAFATAHGGTLFLDEIGDLPLMAQAKILRVIETGEVVRVGGTRKHVDVRLVTATHRDLEAMVGEGSFREDLYYRLRVIEVTLPRLKDRADDILPLAQFFLRRSIRPDGRLVEGISARAANCLATYGWPGNIRELRNVIDRATVLDDDGIIDIDDLPHEIGSITGQARPTDSWNVLLELLWPEAKDRFEEIYFKKALERHGGAVQRTAEGTGVDRRTLSTKIARYGLRGRKDDGV